MNQPDPLLAPIPGATHRDLGSVTLDIVRAGDSRIKRVIYKPGFRWSTQMKPVVGTDLCMHAHVGFLARGSIGVKYADGCTVEFTAPQVVAIDPGHDGWVIGDEQAILIEIDFEGETAAKLGIPATHQHR
ncbi:MAG: hypothetical protein ABI665_28815 [Vicinamibacterales bacterium]